MREVLLMPLLVGRTGGRMLRGLLFVVLALSPLGAQEAISKAFAKAEARGWHVHAAAVRLSDGKPVALWRAAEPAIPASAQKILTGGSALVLLGREHEILTDLVAHGSYEDGVLDGVLRLRGEGDPSLGWEELLGACVARAQEAGLRRVTGDLLVDDRLFAPPAPGPAWPDAQPASTWLAYPAALMPEGGTIVFAIRGPEEIGLEPAGTGIDFVSELRACRKGEKPSIALVRPRALDRFTLEGRARVGRVDRRRAAVADAPMIAGRALEHALAAADVVVEGTVRRARGEEYDAGGKLLARLRTPLAELLPEMMKSSDNPIAEALFAHVGGARFGRGDAASGARAVRAAYGALDLEASEAVRPRDGSGLSRDNRVAARDLAEFLAALSGHEDGRVLRGVMAHGGESGSTLRRRLEELGERVRAKTGTLRDVTALAGYLEPRSGDAIAFAMLTRSEKASSAERNAMRELIDRFVAALDSGVFGG